LTVSINGLAVSVMTEGKVADEAEALEMKSMVRVTGKLDQEQWELRKEGKQDKLVVLAESVKLAKLPDHGRLGVYGGDVP